MCVPYLPNTCNCSVSAATLPKDCKIRYLQVQVSGMKRLLGEECSYTFQQTKHPSAHTPTVATKTWHGQHACSSPAQAFLASQLNLTSLWWIIADHLMKEALICANANVMLLYLVIIHEHCIKIIVFPISPFAISSTVI